MGDDGKKSTELLNTAEFRDKRDEAMLRSHRAGNRQLRLIPEVRDHGDRLEEPADDPVADDAQAPPRPPDRSASGAIDVLEASLPIMSEVDVERVRSMLPTKSPASPAPPAGPPLIGVFFAGVVIGALITLFAYRSQLRVFPTAGRESGAGT